MPGGRERLGRRYQSLFDAVAILTVEAGDEDSDRRFDLASVLYINYINCYED